MAKNKEKLQKKQKSIVSKVNIKMVKNMEVESIVVIT